MQEKPWKIKAIWYYIGDNQKTQLSAISNFYSITINILESL